MYDRLGVVQLGLQSKQLNTSIEVKALNGPNLFSIAHRTELVELCFGNHKEQISFLLFQSSCCTLVLEYLWLGAYNPTIDWRTGGVLNWG